MSISRFAALVKAWPVDALKRPICLKTNLEEQLGLYQSGERAGLPGLGNQVSGIQDLLDDKYKKMYPVSDKLLRPAGKPMYYDQLRHEFEHGVQEPSRWQKFKVFLANGI
ncbi:hypothetical protein BZA70DRAFT_280489 [Myxozyma melibiosi]|uniref:Uncharacterized protein n=1 Tax=Myxozyma melibiosi TaxID=54550 RepID=A0ABR1F398_9ASCO